MNLQLTSQADHIYESEYDRHGQTIIHICPICGRAVRQPLDGRPVVVQVGDPTKRHASTFVAPGLDVDGGEKRN